jgi:hypothetical protein
MIRIDIQKPNYGSAWYRGNFNLGICVDNHPRFTNVLICFWFVEIIFSWTRVDKKA